MGGDEDGFVALARSSGPGTVMPRATPTVGPPAAVPDGGSGCEHFPAGSRYTGVHPSAAASPEPQMSEEAATDAELIAASVADRERFAEIFARHGAAVHRYLARRLGRELADDLTAEVFVGAFRYRARYRATSSTALPWLFGIAANVAAQHRREQAQRWRLLAALPVDREGSSQTDEADDRLTAGAFRPVLVEALLSLPPVERQVLLLVAWEQLNSTEIAEALGVLPATARTRLHRARAKIRARLLEGSGAEGEATSLEEFLSYE